MTVGLRGCRLYTYKFKRLLAYYPEDAYGNRSKEPVWTRSGDADKDGFEYYRIVTTTRDIADVLFKEHTNGTWQREVEIVETFVHKIDEICIRHAY